MRYAFLTALVPEQMDERVRALSKNNMQDAANALQWNIWRGLYKNLGQEIRIFNILPIGSFPQYYKKAFVKQSRFATEASDKNINIGFCNVKLIRKFRQPKKIFSCLSKWCAEDDEEKTLFVYTASAVFLNALEKLKRDHPELRVITVVADLPDMSSLASNQSAVKRLFQKYLSDSAYSKLSVVDGFVLLTKQMADYMKLTVPYCVMEGIASCPPTVKPADTSEIKTVLYTGTLHRRFGIIGLLEAFKLTKSEKYRLVICGIGDSEEDVRRASEQDKRIIFKGQLTRDDALELQRQATVLVNPRQNNEEFTKYSFPSKTMEYLASGVPLVAYKLDGIPDDYDEYINYVPDNLPAALAEKLTEILEMPEEERRVMGEKGRAFVLENKNADVQTRRILEFIKENF